MNSQRPNLRVGYVTKMFPRLSETFVLNEILELERQGAEVVVFSAKKPNEGVFQPQLARLQARVLYLEDLDLKKWANWVSADWDALGPFSGNVWDLVRQALRDGAPDRVDLAWHGAWIACRAQELRLDRLHAHFATLPAALAHTAHRVSGIPYSFTAHAKDIYVYSPEETRMGELIEHADYMVTVTEFNRRHLMAVLPGVDPDKIKVVHNGIDLDAFQPVPASRREPAHILAVGRLVAKKGFDDLLEACALLRERGVAFRCTIAGGGTDAAALELRQRELGLEDVVTFTGPIRVDAVRELMSRATVFALPCRVAADNNVDALPTVLLEALACSLPVVTTAVSGIPEIVTDGQEGLLLPPDDPAALAKALATVLGAADLRAAFGERGRRKALSHFDQQRNVAELHELLRTGGRRASTVNQAGGAAPDDAPRMLYVCTDRGIAFGGTKGASIHVREFLDAAVAEGATVCAAVRRRDAANARPTSFPVQVLAAEKSGLSLDTPAAAEGQEYAVNAGFVAQLEELHRESGFNCVYERYSLFGLAGLAFARRAGLPFVLEVNAPLVEEAKAFRSLQLESLARDVAAHLFAAADHVVAVSNAVRDHIRKLAPDARVIVVPNGVDTDIIRPGVDSAHWREAATAAAGDAFVVGFVGRVRPWHGVDILIDAFAQAHAADPSLRLCVVGELDGIGPSLRDRCQAHGLESHVCFAGAVTPVEIPQVLGAMDAVVAPYPQLQNFYFSPLKVFEYMAAGKPIVASAIGQINDILEHERTALLVAPGDATELASAILRLRAEPELAARLGRAARVEAETRHTWRERVRTVLDLMAIPGARKAVGAS